MPRVAQGFLTQSQVQVASGISRRTLRALIKVGLLPARRLTADDVVVARLLLRLGYHTHGQRHLDARSRLEEDQRAHSAAHFVRECLSQGQVGSRTRLLAAVAPPHSLRLVHSIEEHQAAHAESDTDVLDLGLGVWLQEAQSHAAPDRAA